MDEKTTKQYIGNIDIEQKILSSIDNGILILNEELNILYFNNWLEIHTGMKTGDVLNKPLDSVFKDINTKTLIRKIKTALTLGTPTFCSAATSKYVIPIKINQIKISNFTYMQQDVSIIPFDAQKRLVALVITDQTNMSEANAHLEENILKIKELNDEILKERDTIDKKVLLMKFDLDNKIRSVSQAHMELFGFSKDELIDHDFFVFERLHLYKELKQNILQHMKEKKVFKFEQKTLNKEGKELWMSNSLIPEYDASGNHTGFIMFRIDMTDSKILHMHQDKLLSNSRSSAMGEMISMIAHQWRQPLSLINTVLATLRFKNEVGQLDKNEMNESFNKMETTVTYLSETISDFRDFFKPNKLVSDVLLCTIFEKSNILLREEMKHLEITYTEDIDKDLEIVTYKNELIQSIINILKNSVDAFKENDIKDKFISVKIKKEKTHISIYLKDNAGGIKEEVLKKIFEPYFSTKSKNGTGLGLYMCKTIIEEHLNGKITIFSENMQTQTLIELPYNIENNI